MIDEMGDHVKNVIKMINGGVLVFFSSY